MRGKGAAATTAAPIAAAGVAVAVSSRVADFEAALTPVQRYALHFSEFIDPQITAKQMRDAQKNLQLEDAKWKAKQLQATKCTGERESRSRRCCGSRDTAIRSIPHGRAACKEGAARFNHRTCGASTIARFERWYRWLLSISASALLLLLLVAHSFSCKRRRPWRY